MLFCISITAPKHNLQTARRSIPIAFADKHPYRHQHQSYDVFSCHVHINWHKGLVKALELLPVSSQPICWGLQSLVRCRETFTALFLTLFFSAFYNVCLGWVYKYMNVCVCVNEEEPFIVEQQEEVLTHRVSDSTLLPQGHESLT